MVSGSTRGSRHQSLCPGPVILVIHARGNDICLVRLDALLTIMRADVERITGFFPQVIPRVLWQGARDATAVKRSCQTINIRMSRIVGSLGEVVVRHHQLEGHNRYLMMTDRVHLNDISHDIFLSALQDGIEQALFLLGGGRSSV